MQVWTIVVDHVKDNWEEECIFEDRLFFCGLNLNPVMDQLTCLIHNPHKLLTSQWELDYDDCIFLSYQNSLFQEYSDDCVLQCKLTHSSDKGTVYTYLHFRLILLDLHEHSTAQTKIPEDIISVIRETLETQIPKS